MIKVIIVDDESPARAKLRRLVQEEPDATVVAEASDGTQCLEAIRNHGADVVFLDVQMPGVTGIEVARVLVRERNPLVVFVSAHESYAVTAFSLEVTDYLLKPVAPARFRATFARIRRALNLRSSAAVHVDASRYV
jgi:two-component system LytT family response regulator